MVRSCLRSTSAAIDPDEVTYKLVGAASEVLGIPPNQVLEAFGEYWIIYGSGAESEIRIDRAAFDAILSIVEGNGSRDEILAMIRSWRFESVRLPLLRLGSLAQDLGRNLDKGELEVVVEAAHELRLDPARWRTFWSVLIHVIRNAVDHGLEPPDERAAAGKRANGRIVLAAAIDGGRFQIDVIDDGRGIDWSRIAARAARLGLPFRTADELCDAAFTDGVSTRDTVSATSGRGVGLAAVRSACLALDGKIQVDSTLGVQTRFRFGFPVSTVAYASPDILRGEPSAEPTLSPAWPNDRGSPRLEHHGHR
jgi:two-component system chemotaxis sensor kinase CheA